MAKSSFTFANGKVFPSLGLGTWNSAPGEVRAAVTAALESGYRHIDCAAGYGNENEVGDAIADVISRGVCKREDIFVTSKLWVLSNFPEKVVAACDKTLADLKLSYVDLYLVHWHAAVKGTAFPPAQEDLVAYTPERYLAVWREMEKLVDAGKVKSIGCSNHSVRKLTELLPACRIRPAANQVESHPYLAQPELKAFCEANNIVLIAYSPLGSPARPARLNDGEPAPLHDAVVAEIAGRLGVTASQVLLRWSLQRGVAVIPKSVTPSRIVENFNVWGFVLGAEDMAALNALDKNMRLLKGKAFWTAGETYESFWDVASK